MSVTGGQNTRPLAVQCHWSLNAFLNKNLSLIVANEKMWQPFKIHLNNMRQAAFDQLWWQTNSPTIVMDYAPNLD